jgi:two-component system chemotaxis response regulator CheY
MLLKCPSCGAHIRLTDPVQEDKIRYLCQGCNQIVHLDVHWDSVPTTSAPPPNPSLQHTHRILIVDDSETFLALAGDLLLRDGFEVSKARDGFEGLRKITTEKPDLVLLDLSMPGLSGFEVLQSLRTDSAYKPFLNIPILVTSGVYNPAEIELVRDYGASGFLNKESVQDLLVYRVRTLLATKPVSDL